MAAAHASNVPARRHRLRSDIYQAAWNYKYRENFPLLCFVLALGAGVLASSWWVGLGTFAFLSLAPDNRYTIGILSFIWGITWAVVGGVLLSPFGAGALVTGGMIGFALAWVPMRASEQYWRDLEQDGGPYSD